MNRPRRSPTPAGPLPAVKHIREGSGGSETSATGSINAVCTNAIISAEEVIRVIAQAAPTPMINRPKLDNRLAVQIRRNTACRSGERMPTEARARWSPETFIA